MSIKRFLFWLWPPCKAKIANKYILGKSTQITRDEVRKQIESKINECFAQAQSDAQKDLLLMAREIRESELKRKETIENKATTFIYAIGFSLTILSLVLAVLCGQWGITGYKALFIAIFYFISVIFLLVSAFYSVKVRRVEAFYSLCADTFFDILGANKDWVKKYLSELITVSKLNEARLTVMTNHLSVAETLFIRGLTIFAVASFIAVLIKVFNCK